MCILKPVAISQNKKAFLYKFFKTLTRQPQQLDNHFSFLYNAHKEIFMTKQEFLSEFISEIQSLLENEELIEYCKKVKRSKFFDEDFDVALEISKIDISKIKVDKSLIANQRPFSQEQMKKEGGQFFEYLDSLYPKDFSLAKLYQKNLQFLEMDKNPDGRRSYCSAHTDENGNLVQKIYVNCEDRIGDLPNMIHEFGHSFCDTLAPSVVNNQRTTEIPTLILDRISPIYLADKHPAIKKNLIENRVFKNVQQVRKAVECVADGVLVNVLSGSQSLEDALKDNKDLIKKYPDFFLSSAHKFNRDNKPTIMREISYLFPEMIAQQMQIRFEQEPEHMVEQLKTLIKHNKEWDEQQVAEYLNLGNKREIVENYAQNFDKEIKSLEKSRGKGKLKSFFNL